MLGACVKAAHKAGERAARASAPTAAPAAPGARRRRLLYVPASRVPDRKPDMKKTVREM